MTIRRRFAKNAVIATTAALLASGTVYAVAPRTVTYSATREPISSPNDSTRLVTWLSKNTLPELDDGVAVRNTGAPNFKLTPPALLASRTHHVAQSSACTEQWHPLASGPLGREYSPLCPGEALLPMPREDLKLQLHLQLPSLALFNRAFEGSPLDPAYSINVLDAEHAARSVADALGTQIEEDTRLVPGQTTISVPSFLDPLGWSVPRNVLRQSISSLSVPSHATGGHHRAA